MDALVSNGKFVIDFGMKMDSVLGKLIKQQLCVTYFQISNEYLRHLLSPVQKPAFLEHSQKDVDFFFLFSFIPKPIYNSFQSVKAFHRIWEPGLASVQPQER